MNLNLTKEQQLIILGLIASIVVGLGIMAFRHFAGQSFGGGIVIEKPKGGHSMIQTPTVMVHVSGAVGREGVYKLNSGDRLLDALELAGGALPNADLSAVNLAETVKDGERVIIPLKRIVIERASGNQDIRVLGTSLRKVNLNTADEKALDSLPGVGPATAKAIIEYRRTNGPFARIEQIMEIPRFGRAKFEKLKDRIAI